MKNFAWIFLIFLSFSTNAFCQAGIPTIAFAGKTVKDIIRNFEGTGNRLLQNGQTVGNGVASKVGDEVLVATQNLSYYFDKNMNKTFENLRLDEQNIFVELNKTIDSFNKLNTTISTVSELTNLDLIALTNRINLLTNKNKFFISSINGITLINNNINHNLEIRGIGFGLGDDNEQYRNSILVKGRQLPVTSINLTQRRTMIINISDELLNSSFKAKELVYVPVQIHSEIITHPWYKFGKEVVSKYDTKFNLILLPSIAGYMTIEETVETPVLDGKTLTHDISRSFQSCKTDNPCVMVENWRCADNQKIMAVRYDCSGQCGWSYNKRIGGYSPDYDIQDGGRSVTVYRYLDGENATVVIYHIDYQTYVSSYTKIKSKEIPLKYDEPFDYILDVNNSGCNYSLTGKLQTGQLLNYNNSSIASSPYLKLLGVGKVGNSCTASFKLSVPQ